MKTANLFFDGGSRGNPGLSAGASVIKISNQETIIVSEIMKKATNNEAEYLGLLLGLRKAVDLEIQKIDIYGDSQLIIKQLLGDFAVKAQNLKHYYHLCHDILNGFDKYSLNHIRREKNIEADAECNRLMDKYSGISHSTPLKRESSSDGFKGV